MVAIIAWWRTNQVKKHAHAHALPAQQPPLWRGEDVNWMAPAALLIATIAAALAIWTVVNKTPDSSAAARQDGDSKTRVCTAFDTVARAVQLQTHAELGPDPVAQPAVAGNARLAMVGGGDYLLSQPGLGNTV